MSFNERVVILVDMDCFYCQVEENLDPKLRGKPIAVVQYNAWKGGGIIAVNYPARDRGVTRHMRGQEAQAKCGEIQLVRVPNVRGKADLTKYREAGKRVAEVLQTFTPLLERASVDEAYLDITEAVNKRLQQAGQIIPSELKNSHVVGFDDVETYLNNIYESEFLNENNLKLAVGGAIAEEIRAAVYNKTGYKCSAGIAHNKILAKLVCGLHKPNQQTILPQDSIELLYKDLPVRKIKSLGGKFGNHLSEKLSITNMGQLYQFSEKELAKHFDEKTTLWLYNIARGIDTEPVTVRLVSKSIGCCKKFPGRTALKTHEDVRHWLNELALEISERLEKDLEENNRRAKQMVISFSQQINRKDVASSRSHILNSYESPKIMLDAYEVIKKHCLRSDDSYRIKFLGISVTKFEDNKTTGNITSFFKNFVKKEETSTTINKDAGGKGSESNSLLSAKQSEMIDSLMSINNNDKNQTATSTSDNSSCIETSFKEIIEDGNSNGNESADSISGELSFPKSNLDNIDRSSFFKSYFSKLSPADRNFNTSLVLESELDRILDEELNSINSDIPEVSSPILNTIPTPKINDEISSEAGSEPDICSECNKRIPIYDMPSHMDYHFALKMVREEAHLYKPTQIVKPEPTKTKQVKKSTKRKNISSCSNLTSFLTSAGTEQNVVTEICSECSRKIPTDQFADHLDYHVAKKLHLEINPQNTLVEKKKCDNKSDKSKKIKYSNNVPAITTFFKPV